MTGWGADLNEALTLVWALCMGENRGHVVRLGSWERGRIGWTSLPSAGRLLHLVHALGVEHELEMFAAARHPRMLGVAKDGITALWVRSESKDSYARLRRFSCTPTLVLGEGRSAREVAFWAVRRPHTVEQARRGVCRLAYHLRCKRGGSRAAGDPDSFRFNPPGCFLREGRREPVPVVVRFMDARAVYAPRALYGELRDPPDPDAWKERRNAA